MPSLCLVYQSATDVIPVLEPIVVFPIGCIVKAMFVCDNGCTKCPVEFIPFAPWRFNMSLDTSIAEILIVSHSIPHLSFRIEWE